MAKKPVPKKPKKKQVIEKQVTGRPKLPIDWDVVDRCLISGSNGTQTAAFIGVYPDTLYDRCVSEKKMPFTAYTVIMRQKGNSLLLGKQYQVAMTGDKTMLVWLGKQRLKQTDQPTDKQEFNGSLSNLLNIMHMIKSSSDFDRLITMGKEKEKEVKQNE